MNTSAAIRQVVIEVECPWCAGSARVSERSPAERFECGTCAVSVEIVDAGAGSMERSRRRAQVAA